MLDFLARKALARLMLARLHAMVDPLLDEPDRGTLSYREKLQLEDGSMAIEINVPPGRADLCWLIAGRREVATGLSSLVVRDNAPGPRGKKIRALQHAIRGMRQVRDSGVRVVVSLPGEVDREHANEWMSRPVARSPLTLDQQREAVARYLRDILVAMVDEEDEERVVVDVEEDGADDVYHLDQRGEGKSLRGLFLGKNSATVKSLVTLSQAYACAQGFLRQPMIRVRRDDGTTGQRGAGTDSYPPAVHRRAAR